MNDLDWKQPALIGGLIVGILSAVPGISAVNLCCCAWALLGGIVAVKLTIGRSQRPIKTSEGAQIGAAAGLIGAVIFCIVAIPIIVSGLMTNSSLKLMAWIAERANDPKLQQMMDEAIKQAASQTAAQRLVSSLPVLFVQAIIFCGFTVLGGLLGVALFEKRKGEFPPSQYPPNYPPADYPPPPGGQGGWPQS
ncbi:MAG: hypothetical protein ABIP14_13875 [Blastocatellia bacterium]